MKLVLTGSRGFLGSTLVPHLAALGHSGIATGRQRPANLPSGWTGHLRGDVLGDSAPTIDDLGAIVHLEVKQHVPRPTAADAREFTEVNVAGTRAWLDWAGRRGVSRFLLMSSIKAVAAGSGPNLEDAPPETVAAYGRSKAEAERAVCDWAAADPTRSAVILRPAPVYGPGNEANLAAFVRQILAGKPCLIGRGETQKSIVSLANLCGAIAFAIEHGRPGCLVFNVSDRETPSLGELAGVIAETAGAGPPKRIPAWVAAAAAPIGDAIESLTGRDFPLTTARLRAIRETTIFPCDKLIAAGFVHPQTTREGIAEMVAWARGRQ